MHSLPSPQACLLENPKSYAAWHQRKWVVLKGYADVGAELRLVARCGGGGAPRAGAAVRFSVFE